MRKIFLITLAMLLSCKICFAADIYSAVFNDNENLVYPVVKTGDSMIDNRINIAIIAKIDRFLTEIYRDAQVNGYEVADIRTNYEIACNQAGNTVILSILMTESSYFKGAAHPSTFKHALNFNLSSGELMDINYLLEVGEGIKDGYLIECLNQKLAEKVANEQIFLFGDALPLKNLPETFYWDENLHVHFIFQQYDIAPYAAGIIDVDIDA